MQAISIEIPKETISIEMGRPPEAMRYEDFIWCVGVSIHFGDKMISIDAPLFGFMKKVIKSMEESVSFPPGSEITVQDENQSYEFAISTNDDTICIHDIFSNATTYLPSSAFRTALRAEYAKATQYLEKALPRLFDNPDYQKIKMEIQGKLDAC